MPGKPDTQWSTVTVNPREPINLDLEEADLVPGAYINTLHELGINRPLTRGDCVDGPRPCPWVGCYYNLRILDVASRGRLKIRKLGVLSDIPQTCVLDVADRYGIEFKSGSGPSKVTLAQIGNYFGVTQERVRQIEKGAIEKVADELDLTFEEAKLALAYIGAK